MKRSEWSEKHIEELLKQLPKIQDTRKPQDIYQNLSAKLKKRKRQTWILPSLAAAAALFLFFILAPNLNLFTFSSQSLDHSTEKKSSIADKSASPMLKLEKKETTSRKLQNSDSANIMSAKAMSTKTAIYENEVGNGKVLTYWIPDQQAQILVPVSTILNNPGDKTWLELFNENVPKLNEAEWGLSEYYPLNAKLELDNEDNSLIINVPSNNTYGDGSTNEGIFIDAIERNVYSNSTVDKIKLFTEGKPGIMFGNSGEKTELNVQISQNHAYYLFNPKSGDIPFIVPSLENFTNINDAFEAMRNDRVEDGLKASIPPKFQFSVDSINDSSLTLTIPSSCILEDTPSNVYSLEAILLTAKEFGFENVILKDPSIKNLGPFDLTKEIKVPVAPNLRTLNDQP